MVTGVDGGRLAATHWGIVENFRNHLLGGAPPACDGAAGRKSSVVLDVVSLLPHDDRPVPVDYANPPDADRLRAAGMNLLA